MAVALALLGLAWWVAQGAPTDTAPAQWQRPVMFDQAADGSVLAIEPSTVRCCAVGKVSRALCAAWCAPWRVRAWPMGCLRVGRIS